MNAGILHIGRFSKRDVIRFSFNNSSTVVEHRSDSGEEMEELLADKSGVLDSLTFFKLSSCFGVTSLCDE